MHRQKTLLAPIVIAAVATLLAPLPALAASKQTARASGTLSIRSGPGSHYAVIGKLKDGVRVHLERCTRDQDWCLFVDKQGDPVGWVRGGDLVGSPAKLEVTPSRLFDDDWGLFPRPRPFHERDFFWDGED